MDNIVAAYFGFSVFLFLRFTYYDMKFYDYAVRYYRIVRKEHLRIQRHYRRERLEEFSNINDAKFQHLLNKRKEAFTTAIIFSLGGVGIILIVWTVWFKVM